MGDKDGGDPEVLVHTADEIAHLGAQMGVEGGQRLVKEQDLRFHDQRAGKRDAGLLAARQLGRAALAKVGQVHEVEHRSHAGGDRGCGKAAHAQAEAHVGGHGHEGEEQRILEHHDGAAILGPVAQDRTAVECDIARGGREQARDQPERRRLAAARGAEQGDKLSAFGIEGEAVKRGGGRAGIGARQRGKAKPRHVRPGPMVAGFAPDRWRAVKTMTSSPGSTQTSPIAEAMSLRPAPA